MSKQSQVTIGGVYANFKEPDHHYRVIGIGRRTETGEPLVVYQPLFPGSQLEQTGEQFWVRPRAMFTEHVTREGYVGPRFTPVGDS